MRRAPFLFFSLLCFFPSISPAKELPKIAVWDLAALNISPSYVQHLTSILVSEISDMKKYEVYSQEDVRTLAGWTAERMQLGCTDSKCLTVLGQMDIAKLISGSVGKIGKRYTVSLNLFDTQNARAENAISKICESEDELIELVQVAARTIIGVAFPVKVKRPSVPLIGNLGMSERWSSAWLDLDAPINFKKGDKLRLKIGGTANKILVRVLPRNEFPNQPVGILTEPINVPINRIVEIELQQPYKEIIQISVHGGEKAWHYFLGKNNGPVNLYFVELIPSI